MKNIGVILAGGFGSRFGSSTPKQYLSINNKEIISYSIEAFGNSKLTDKLIVVVDEDEKYKNRIEDTYKVECIRGGKSRNASLYNALKYIESNYECENVLFHEAARPFITASIIDEYFNLLTENDAVITSKKITDSLGKIGQHVTDRSEYYLIQAPEAFKFDLILNNFSPDSDITATVQQLPENIKMKKYFDFPLNYKVTYPEDLIIAEQIMKISK